MLSLDESLVALGNEERLASLILFDRSPNATVNNINYFLGPLVTNSNSRANFYKLKALGMIEKKGSSSSYKLNDFGKIMQKVAKLGIKFSVNNNLLVSSVLRRGTINLQMIDILSKGSISIDELYANFNNPPIVKKENLQSLIDSNLVFSESLANASPTRYVLNDVFSKGKMLGSNNSRLNSVFNLFQKGFNKGSGGYSAEDVSDLVDINEMHKVYSDLNVLQKQGYIRAFNLNHLTEKGFAFVDEFYDPAKNLFEGKKVDVPDITNHDLYESVFKYKQSKNPNFGEDLQKEFHLKDMKLFRLFRAVANKPYLTARHLSNFTDMGVNATRKQLKILRDQGFVKVKEVGRKIMYYPSNP